MLYAKISPAAQITVQDGPFSTKVESIEFITIDAFNYTIGAESTIFIVRYGSPVFINEIFVGFNSLYTQHLNLTADQLATWGTDDSVLFDIIGENQGFQIVEIFDTTPVTTTTTTTSL
jgi:hypothetical protein